uniref:PiggyBac transposable element-derived protein 4 n=1 Tax=Lygus hesperus TaxID=30085 RepID=A0A0A9XHK9_LYGHE
MSPVNSERSKKRKPHKQEMAMEKSGTWENIKVETTTNTSANYEMYDEDVYEFKAQTSISNECDPLEINPISYQPPVKTIKVEERCVTTEEPSTVDFEIKMEFPVIEAEHLHESARDPLLPLRESQSQVSTVENGVSQTPSIQADPLSDERVTPSVSCSEDDLCSSDEEEPTIETFFSVVEPPGCVNLFSVPPGAVGMEPVYECCPDRYSWTSEEVQSGEIPFTSKPGLRYTSPLTTPYDFFRYIISDNFCHIFMNQVNQCASEMAKGSKRLSKKRNVKTLLSQWKPVCLQQFEVWLGILIHMGGIQNSSFNHYWSSETMHHSTFFAEVPMSKDRWLGIMQALHFMGKPKDSEKSEPFFKLRPLIRCFNEEMKALYVPDRELCLEDPVVLWKGRLVPWGCLKDKKDATKLHSLTEPGGLILRFSANTMDVSNETSASKIARRLLSDFMDKGYSIFMDRCYNSVALCHVLRSRQVLTTGPLAPSRMYIPQRILASNPDPGHVVYTRSNHDVVVMKYADDYDQVLFISSEFNPYLLKTTYKSFEKLKPEAVTAYDKFVSGLSSPYCHLSDYGAILKHANNHVRISIHLIEMAVYNAFVLYKKYASNNLDYAAFRAELARKLTGLKKCVKK